MLNSFRSKVIAAGVVFVVVAVVSFLYFQGGLALGAESYTLKFAGGGFGSSRRGWSIGSKSVYLRKDQVLNVAYDADIKKGILSFYLVESWAPFGKDPVRFESITASGKGNFRVKAPEDGWYKLRISPQPDGRGYDIDYSASWNASAAP